MKRIILTGMPEFMKLIWELKAGEAVVAGTIGVVVAVAGIIFLWKLINRRCEELGGDHEGLEESLWEGNNKLENLLEDKSEKFENSLRNKNSTLESSLKEKSDKLENICNDTNKRIYGFIKAQEAIRQTENQAREANVDLNQFMQSASAVFAQNANFAIEKQNLENKIISAKNELAKERQERNLERQDLQGEIEKLKKELKVIRKKNNQSYDDR